MLVGGGVSLLSGATLAAGGASMACNFACLPLLVYFE